MTVTLDIPSSLEPLFQEKATQRGQALPDYILSLAEAGLYAEAGLNEDDWQTEENLEEEVAIITQGLADLHAGDKGMLLEDYRAEVMAKRAARKQQQEAGAIA